MGDEDKDQKTEDPTEKKIRDSFEKGKTANSREVSATIVLLAAAGLLWATGGYMRVNLMDMMRHTFSTAAEMELTTSSIRPIVVQYMKVIFLTIAPVSIVIMLAGIAASLMQNGGIIFTLDPLMPKFSKLNPLTGFGRIMGKQAVMELFKSIGKIAIVGFVAYQVVKSEWDVLPNLGGYSLEDFLMFVSWISIKLMLYTIITMMIIAIADYAFQRYTFMESLKMTMQEVKDERKDTDGNPMIKQRIRTTQMEMARKRMMQDVPKADVIITNPTHLAIAMRYDRETMATPTVVAKGAGNIAKRIKEIAKENNIPIVEDKPLARILFKTIDIGRGIPEDLFKAIAEILAYVYRLKSKSL